MQISVSDAKARLTELVRRADAGEEIVLTRHGRPVVRLAPIVGARNRKARLAPSWDFLFGADGLPE